MIKISTSILSSKDRINSIQKLNNTNSDYIHIDVMDNIFVPNYQFPLEEIKELSKYSSKPLDIHLMVANPKKYINSLYIKNIYNITIHIEINKDIDSIIELIKEKNCSVGLAIKPNTPLNLIDKYLKKVDMILIMSVEPGFGGQKFIENTTERIKYIRNKNKNIIIEVDGGINNETIRKIKDIANIAVVGSYITNKEDYEEAINNLKN